MLWVIIAISAVIYLAVGLAVCRTLGGRRRFPEATPLVKVYDSREDGPVPSWVQKRMSE